MQIYKFKLTKEEKDAVYAGLYHMIKSDFGPEVYTPELTISLRSENPEIELTQEQLRAVLNGLRQADESTSDSSSAHLYRQARLSLIQKSREQYRLIC